MPHSGGDTTSPPAPWSGLRWLAWSVRVRLATITALAFIPACVMLFVSAGELRRARESEIRSGVIEDARSVSAELRSLFAGLEATLRLLESELQLHPGNAACNALLKRVVPDLSAFNAVTVIDEAGRVSCGTRDTGGRTDVSDRSYFTQAITARGALFVGEYTIGRVSGEGALPLSIALSGGDPGRRVLSATVRIAWLAEHLAKRGVERGSSITISDRDGVIIFREPFSERFVGTRIPDAFQRLVKDTQVGAELLRSQDGTLRYLGYVPPAIGAPYLYVSAGVSVESSLALIEEAIRLNVLLVGLAALGSVTAATWAGHTFIHRQLLRIMAVTSAWRSGDYSKRTGMRADEGEIGSVGSALDIMVDELAGREEERRRAEEQRLVLVRELQHRVKNTLAVVQAIAGQSLRGTPESRGQLDAFRDRLAALATTYDILTEENWRGAGLRAVIADTMKAQTSDARISLSGPDLRIKPNAALAISLAMHELATNALKHGALSVPSGRVEVVWAVDPADRSAFMLDWTETGGPDVSPPERSGFGTTLLSRILTQQVHGTTEVAWRASGLCFTLRCPLTELTGTD